MPSAADMFGLSKIRLGIYVAVALALGGLLWHDHYQTAKANRLAKETNQLRADIQAERENTRKANESAQRYAARITSSRGPRSPPLRIMCKLPSSVPQGAAASGTDDATVPDDTGVHEAVDIGPRIDVPFRACEENLIKLDELQRWVRDR